LDSALTGTYSAFSSTWTSGLIDGAPGEIALGGDDVSAKNELNKLVEFDCYDVRSTNASMPVVFRGLYKAVQGANNIILNYENTAGDPDVIRVIAGEAYFLRGYCYFYLTKTWGKIPLILSPDFTEEALNTSKAEYKDIYSQIENDLQQAETMLNDARREYGRPSVGSAKAILAEVYLNEGGWPLKESEKYALAAAKAKEVIDNHVKYGFDLVTGDETRSAYDILYENDDTKSVELPEDIFVIPCVMSANSSNCMYGFWACPSEINGWECAFSEYTFFEEFPDGPRKDATFALSVKKTDGTVLHYTELLFPHPYYKKLFISENANFYANDSNLPMRLLRYTQTVLTYAEAKARSGGPDALAYQCVNDIRRRAELPPLSGLSAENFAKAVVQERAWELCGEWVRWYDLVRLEMLEEVYSKKDPRDHPRISSDAWENHYTFPMPETDLLLNPNLR
jgi:hypothetical protein